MKRVAIISKPFSPPFRDGTLLLVKNLVEGLPSFRFELGAPLLSSFRMGDARILRIFPGRQGFTSTIPQYFINLLRFTLSKGVDIYHFLFTPAPATAGLISGISGLKKGRFLLTVTSSPALPIEGLDLRAFHRIVTLTDWTSGRFRGAGYGNVTRIYPCVALPRYEKGGEGDCFTYPGELQDEEAVDSILGALSILKRRGRRGWVVFACRSKREGERRREVKRFFEKVEEIGVADRISFAGETNDLPSIFSSSRAILFPLSSMKGKMDIPLSLLEAMALGRPVVASPLPQLREALSDGGGWTVERGDIEALADLMEELLLRPRMGRVAGGKGRRVVEERFSIERMAREYREVYEGL